MAKVQVQVIGGAIQQLDIGTVGDVKAKLDAKTYTATVNGSPVNDAYALKDYEFVSLAPSVKGA